MESFMQIITGQAISDKVDYSFGDHIAIWDKSIYNGNAKYANAYNTEFLAKAKDFEGKIMTLFIDNIRLYPRKVRVDSEDDGKLVDYLMKTNNLLGLCSLLPSNGFIIFTGQEDTPIDEHIVLPDNVVKVYAVNAIYNTDRVIPIPFGVQRKMNADDRRLEVLLANVLEDKETKPTKLLYINCGIERSHDRDTLPSFDKPENKSWCTTHFDPNSKFFPYDKYQDFLDTLKDHKFLVCPKGHFDTLDCHRIWECLYLRRVPVLRPHPYYDKLMKGFPALYVNEWTDITPELLEKNDHLFQEAQKMDLSKLDLGKIYKNVTQI